MNKPITDTSLAPYPKWWQFVKRRKAKQPVTIQLRNTPEPTDVVFTVSTPTEKDS